MTKKNITKKSISCRAFRTFIVLIMTAFNISILQAQTGTWKAYNSYYEPQQIVKADNYLFVRASNALYQYNLTDKSIVTYDKVNGMNDSDIRLIGWNKQIKRLIVVYQNSNIDLIQPDGNIINISALYRKAMAEDKTIDSLTFDDNNAYLYARFGIVKVNMQRAEISESYTKNNPEYPTSLPRSTINDDWNKYIDEVKTLLPGGPKYNSFTDLKFVDGKLYSVPGYFLSGAMQLNIPGIVQIWDGKQWQWFGEHIDNITGYNYADHHCIDIDPTDHTHIAVGGRTGLYEFKNGQLLKFYNKDNSPMKGAIDRGKQLGNNYVLINGIAFDKQGNLWVLNSQAKNINLLELTKEGKWTNYYQKAMATNDGIGFHALTGAMIDSRDRLWVVNNNWESPAFFAFDINTKKLVNNITTLKNQDGTTYNNYVPQNTIEDLQGNVWISTTDGPFMFENEQTDANYAFQIKIPRNDGTEYADYLLSGVNIKCMAIDGGGRKWFGTEGNGVYLISADNNRELAHFTTDNSPLVSNTIQSIAINPTTGEVFFASTGGLCSYMSDATATATEMTKDNVYAYPNPVTPEYTGLITIVGLTMNTDVKILSSSGKLIAQGRSNGGTFTWDGCDRSGRRVASGVYMVVTATSDGKKGTVCRIAIVK